MVNKYNIGDELIWAVDEFDGSARIKCKVTKVYDDYAIAEADDIKLVIDKDTEEMFEPLDKSAEMEKGIELIKKELNERKTIMRINLFHNDGVVDKEINYINALSFALEMVTNEKYPRCKRYADNTIKWYTTTQF